jgi:hypothetical protein
MCRLLVADLAAVVAVAAVAAAVAGLLVVVVVVAAAMLLVEAVAVVAVRGVGVAVLLRLRLQVRALQALLLAQSAPPSLSVAACPLGARQLLLLLALRSVALAAAWSASRPPCRAPPRARHACPLLARCLLSALAPSPRCLRVCRAAPWGGCARRIALRLWVALCAALARPSLRCFLCLPLCCRRCRHLLGAACVRVAQMCCESVWV